MKNRADLYLKQGGEPGLEPEEALLGLLALEHRVHEADEVQGLRLHPAVRLQSLFTNQGIVVDKKR